MSMNASEARELVFEVRKCNPWSHDYLPRRAASRILNDIETVLEYEFENENGDSRWFYMKLKSSADHHGVPFNLPEGFVRYYVPFQRDGELHRMTGLQRFLAVMAISLGLRPSFNRLLREDSKPG